MGNIIPFFSPGRCWRNTLYTNLW